MSLLLIFCKLNNSHQNHLNLELKDGKKKKNIINISYYKIYKLHQKPLIWIKRWKIK